MPSAELAVHATAPSSPPASLEPPRTCAGQHGSSQVLHHRPCATWSSARRPPSPCLSDVIAGLPHFVAMSPPPPSLRPPPFLTTGCSARPRHHPSHQQSPPAPACHLLRSPQATGHAPPSSPLMADHPPKLTAPPSSPSPVVKIAEAVHPTAMSSCPLLLPLHLMATPSPSSPLPPSPINGHRPFLLHGHAIGQAELHPSAASRPLV